MGVKKYFKKEFQWSMFGLEDDDASQFYLSCFQRNRSVLPLLLIRFIVFLGCLGIVISSMVMMRSGTMWFIFLTHWGLVFIAATAGFAFLVSLCALIRGPLDATFGLPWYVKMYWVTYNLTIPIAFFITIFYWILLAGLTEEYAINKTLDIFIHGINSVLMMVLLVTTSHPSRLLHFHHALLAGIVYLIFSIIYYYAGGLGLNDAVYIYPMLDWSRPGLAAITAVGSAFMILLMHCFVVAISTARNALRRRYTNRSNSLSISNDRYN